ncbi:glycosyltransferase family 4 protein [Prosthecomicrobium sp. N25]|uniref:glycosyltransferase family 4 protein n=1 Tax=Prosthecomicrobium sp. N25 TaxID=3129254 RepID=UPI00307876CA
MTAPIRILFVFGWLVVGGEETELRLLARRLDRSRYRLEVVACFRKDGMPEQTHRQLAELAVPVDTTPYRLSFDDTVSYLAERMAGADIVVACQAVPDVLPALKRMAPERRPLLVEHGGLVCEALAGPKHLTARYVGVCRSICEAARSRMADRPDHVLEIPSMVDLAEFDPAARPDIRRSWEADDRTVLVGWIGRLDRKKRVEDVIRAAALLRARQAPVRFVIVGGADALMPEYEAELHALARSLGLDDMVFTGDRADVPRLLAGLDMLVWCARGEGMPHVIAEAGAAGLAVVCTRDNGTGQQIRDRETGIFVPHEDPAALADAVEELARDPELRVRLGDALRRHVERSYAADRVLPAWIDLFETLARERRSTATDRTGRWPSLTPGRPPRSGTPS